MRYKIVKWDRYNFYIFDNVYEPAEDTFLLAKNLNPKCDDFVLDMGTGCGILAILSALKAERVVAADVNPHAVRCAEINGRVNGVSERIDVIRGNLSEPIREDEIFGLILFNAPYLPLEEKERTDWIDYAWVGGERGRTFIDHFINSAPNFLRPNGRILLVQSTLSGVDETLGKLNAQGLETSIVDERKVTFETITLIKAERRHR